MDTFYSNLQTNLSGVFHDNLCLFGRYGLDNTSDCGRFPGGSGKLDRPRGYSGVYLVDRNVAAVDLVPDYPVYPQAYFLVLAFATTGVVASSLPILLFGRSRPCVLSVTISTPKLLHQVYWVALTLDRYRRSSSIELH